MAGFKTGFSMVSMMFVQAGNKVVDLYKKGTAKVDLDGREVTLPVYSEGGDKLYVKPRMKQRLPRSARVRYNGREFTASLNYRFDRPTYSFKVDTGSLDGGGSGLVDSFDVAGLGRRNRRCAGDLF